MATMTNEDKAALRQFMAACADKRGDKPDRWSKAAVDDGGQAFWDLVDGKYTFVAGDVDSNFPALGARLVNEAAAPHGTTFTNQELKELGDFVFNLRWQSAVAAEASVRGAR